MSTITTFQEVLKGIPRSVFDRFVERHHADKGCKRFHHWDHLLAMVYAQLSGASSLRVLEIGFNSHGAHHRRLKTGPVHRSTLAEASEKRSAVVFENVATWLMTKVPCNARQDAKSMMHLLDSTSVTLKGREFDQWTLANRNRNTQGIKLHVLFDASCHTPAWHCFSAANVNDVTQAWQVPLQSGALYVFDKGYCDYNWWAQIDGAEAHFVTRFKSNAGLLSETERAIPKEAQGIVLRDEIVRFKRKHPSGKRVNHYEKPLRRVTIERTENCKRLVLATNDLVSSALEIGQCYKERWEIELFFKWLKQHLKIKTFFGRSENAVRIQIVTALISYLLVASYKQKHQPRQTLWLCLSLITATLFEPLTPDRTERKRRCCSPKDASQQGAV